MPKLLIFFQFIYKNMLKYNSRISDLGKLFFLYYLSIVNFAEVHCSEVWGHSILSWCLQRRKYNSFSWNRVELNFILVKNDEPLEGPISLESDVKNQWQGVWWSLLKWGRMEVDVRINFSSRLRHIMIPSPEEKKTRNIWHIYIYLILYRYFY